MKNYFDYEGIIRSKDAAEAIAAPSAIGPFCGFGSAVIANNAITLLPNGEPTSPSYRDIKDRILSRYMTKSSESGEGPDINFGCIARDGNIYISDSATLNLSNIEGSKGSNEEVLVFAYHTPLEEPVQNPVQFRAFWNESNSFYGLYKKSMDPLYPNKRAGRKPTLINLLQDDELTYDYLENRAMASIPQGLIDKSIMVLIGIYGQGINALDNRTEKFSIVPYQGKFPQPVNYNIAHHGLQQSNLESLINILGTFPNFDIKKYIDDMMGTIDTSGSTIPKGIIVMWNGTSVPEGWAFCNGQIVGDVQTPDLSGKFIVGWSTGSPDYKMVGNTGGAERVTLKASELASHVHNFEDAYYIENGHINGKDGIRKIGDGLHGSGRTDSDNSTVALWKHDTFASGGGQSHENRPPYYVLAYIIKL